jgi:hypothetical protein
MQLSAAARAVRERLFRDFEFYAVSALFIRTKDQKVVPLELKAASGRLCQPCRGSLIDAGFVRLIILEGQDVRLDVPLLVDEPVQGAKGSRGSAEDYGPPAGRDCRYRRRQCAPQGQHGEAVHRASRRGGPSCQHRAGRTTREETNRSTTLTGHSPDPPSAPFQSHARATPGAGVTFHLIRTLAK